MPTSNIKLNNVNKPKATSIGNSCLLPSCFSDPKCRLCVVKGFNHKEERCGEETTWQSITWIRWSFCRNSLMTSLESSARITRFTLRTTGTCHLKCNLNPKCHIRRTASYSWHQTISLTSALFLNYSQNRRKLNNRSKRRFQPFGYKHSIAGFFLFLS